MFDTPLPPDTIENAIELAWAAGLFEGEGCIRINRPTTRSLGALVCSVTNTDYSLLELFQDRWPGRIKPATGMRPDQRPAWVWTVAALRAVAFLRQIRQYVRSPRVLAKLDLAVQFQAQKRSSRANRLPDYTRRQWEYYERMRSLNVRGLKDPTATRPRSG